MTISANSANRTNRVWNVVSTKSLYIYICVCVYIYIYRERERERDRKRERERAENAKMWKFEQRRAPQIIFQYSANKHIRKS